MKNNHFYRNYSHILLVFTEVVEDKRYKCSHILAFGEKVQRDDIWHIFLYIPSDKNFDIVLHFVK